jgi:hypothetical protein
MLASLASQTAPNPISVRIAIQPQPLSFLGFYDTIFPLDFVVMLSNNGEDPLPAGNLTIHIEAPSTRYSSWDVIPFSTIPPHASAQDRRTVSSAEAGVYIFHVDWYTWPTGRLDLSGTPLTIVNLEGPEIVYGSLGGLFVAMAGLAVTIMSAVVSFAALRRRQQVRQ